jgi:soluble lytic murein transglycosylase-like protein
MAVDIRFRAKKGAHMDIQQGWYQVPQSGPASATLHPGLAAVAIASVFCIAVLSSEVTPREETTAAVEPVVRQAAPPAQRYAPLSPPAYRALTQHLSHRYRIASEASEMLVRITYETGEKIGVDPLLILAVMAIESHFNPLAASDAGAKGLMQVVPKFHLDKLDGENSLQATLYPVTNIRLGALVLKEYIERTGSLEAALQKYNGSSGDSANHYAQRILAERARYEQAMKTTVVIARRAPDAGDTGLPAVSRPM